MEYRINKDYLQEILKMLLTTPSPSGFYHEIMEKVEEEVKRLGYSFEKTKKGCGIITIPGKNSDYTIGFSAHVDTLGAMVRSIKDSGMIRFTPIGGYIMSTVEGEYCKIHTRNGKVYDGTVLTTEPSIHVYSEAKTQKREEANMEIRIDEQVKCKEDVEALGIAVGDYISFDSRTVIMENGFIKSRHLDDKAGVAILFGLMELLKTHMIIPLNNIKLFISTYEEVGHGASFIPEDIDEFIAIDMGAIGDDLNCTEMQVSICAKDSSGPYDYDMVSKLVSLAKNKDIDYAIDVYPYYGSDVSAALKGGNNIKGALVGPGVHASHSMERTHMNALINTIKLITSYIIE
ncbi:M42 family metallopeptidase [Paramaledivibacter caminithermalis]|jgi:putative aminopeptidase FrvX|uniref:Putative aminopeptidase FrvX n=1 Tax=Paramaledivibacter caminithermalis (strain DSM 15212 / CIP 107654 / DViRD3) TaxID=1121301 RepID=A0A1M6MRD1_PARC5|nr:M42 family metallopeptidase [Paramaledivibacter caminithermalis]SHJ86004.1 Putative aminopeptidase FrvX [Paramaledivibacter caminithermalis DSM 15212]